MLSTCLMHVVVSYQSTYINIYRIQKKTQKATNRFPTKLTNAHYPSIVTTSDYEKNDHKVTDSNLASTGNTTSELSQLSLIILGRHSSSLVRYKLYFHHNINNNSIGSYKIQRIRWNQNYKLDLCGVLHYNICFSDENVTLGKDTDERA